MGEREDSTPFFQRSLERGGRISQTGKRERPADSEGQEFKAVVERKVRRLSTSSNTVFARNTTGKTLRLKNRDTAIGKHINLCLFSSGLSRAGHEGSSVSLAQNEDVGFPRM